MDLGQQAERRKVAMSWECSSLPEPLSDSAVKCHDRKEVPAASAHSDGGHIPGLWKLGFPCIFRLVCTHACLYQDVFIQGHAYEFLEPVILEPEGSSPSLAVQVTEMGPLKEWQC